MKVVRRNTEVISISLPKNVLRKLEEARKSSGQSKSALISSLIEKKADDELWERVYSIGRRIAKRYKITSEDDIDRILHEK